jgi:hypothetical protein
MGNSCRLGRVGANGFGIGVLFLYFLPLLSPQGYQIFDSIIVLLYNLNLDKSFFCTGFGHFLGGGNPKDSIKEAAHIAVWVFFIH